MTIPSQFDAPPAAASEPPATPMLDQMTQKMKVAVDNAVDGLIMNNPLIKALDGATQALNARVAGEMVAIADGLNGALDKVASLPGKGKELVSGLGQGKEKSIDAPQMAKTPEQTIEPPSQSQKMAACLSSAGLDTGSLRFAISNMDACDVGTIAPPATNMAVARTNNQSIGLA